jgi:hypothetical protein
LTLVRRAISLAGSLESLGRGAPSQIWRPASGTALHPEVPRSLKIGSNP